ncbi:unnamed protein product [Amoebophrya sp. A120]|nr:unnamed protein product [Amoebophrya sp. A120]|eukprot:GSA120T00009959001.1
MGCCSAPEASKIGLSANNYKQAQKKYYKSQKNEDGAEEEGHDDLLAAVDLPQEKLELNREQMKKPLTPTRGYQPLKDDGSSFCRSGDYVVVPTDYELRRAPRDHDGSTFPKFTTGHHEEQQGLHLASTGVEQVQGPFLHPGPPPISEVTKIRSAVSKALLLGKQHQFRDAFHLLAGLESCTEVETAKEVLLICQEHQ